VEARRRLRSMAAKRKEASCLLSLLLLSLSLLSPLRPFCSPVPSDREKSVRRRRWEEERGKRESPTGRNVRRKRLGRTKWMGKKKLDPSHSVR